MKKKFLVLSFIVLTIFLLSAKSLKDSFKNKVVQSKTISSSSVDKMDMDERVESNRGEGPTCVVSFYHELGGVGGMMRHNVGTEGLYLPDLGPYGLHDQITDIIASTETANVFLITLYRDQNYGGRYISFLIPNRRQIDLRQYVMSKGAYLTWANQATSLKVEYVGDAYYNDKVWPPRESASGSR